MSGPWGAYSSESQRDDGTQEGRALGEWGYSDVEGSGRHETGVGSDGHQGNCLALPFSNLKGADRWGQKVEPERSGRYSGQGDPQAGRRPRTASLRGGAGEARPWETSEEGRSLRGSTRRGVATLGKGGFPFLQKGENTSAGEGMTPRAGPGRELKWRG